MKALVLFLCLISTAFAQEIYKVKDKTIDGKDFDMSSMKDKSVLVVNIASQCGYTPQLAELEALYQKYKSKGLVVLGVPTNDFGGQTPESDVGIKDFCSKNYNATFPILSKRTIKGEEKRELYKYLTEKTSKELKGEVEWNFEKFLVNKKGEVVARYKSKVKPMDEEIIKAVEASLK